MDAMKIYKAVTRAEAAIDEDADGLTPFEARVYFEDLPRHCHSMALGMPKAAQK